MPDVFSVQGKPQSVGLVLRNGTGAGPRAHREWLLDVAPKLAGVVARIPMEDSFTLVMTVLPTARHPTQAQIEAGAREYFGRLITRDPRQQDQWQVAMKYELHGKGRFTVSELPDGSYDLTCMSKMIYADRYRLVVSDVLVPGLTGVPVSMGGCLKLWIVEVPQQSAGKRARFTDGFLVVFGDPLRLRLRQA